MYVLFEHYCFVRICIKVKLDKIVKYGNSRVMLKFLLYIINIIWILTC